MGYYQDLDNDLGAEYEVSENAREELYNERRAATVKKRIIRKEVEKQLKKAGINTDPKPVRGAKVKVNCISCKKEFVARVADRKRGWARYCSKSCKAKRQNNNIGY